MAGLPEFIARAALCRRLAKLEPASGHLWLAEAEKWSRLAQARLRAPSATEKAPGLPQSDEVSVSSERSARKPPPL